MPPSSIVMGALLASAAHALTGPDHLAAVLPLALEQRAQALRVGAYWGMGHGLGVAALGLLSRMLLAHVELAPVSNLCELLVGALLVFVGVRAVRRSRHLTVHEHERAFAHAAAEVTSSAPAAPRGGEPALTRSAHDGHRHGALGFGVLHGMAGGGHLFGALPALALSPLEASLYLGAYLLGAVLSMSVFSAACGRVVSASALPSALRFAGAAAVGVGVLWVGTALWAA